MKRGKKHLKQHPRVRDPQQGKATKRGGDLSTDFINYYQQVLVPNCMPQDDYDQMLERLQVPLPIVFRIVSNIPSVRVQADTYLEQFHEIGVDCSRYDCLPDVNGFVYRIGIDKLQLKQPEFVDFRNWLNEKTAIGVASRQELVSMFPPFFLGLRGGETVLDMCAAPGSKTAQILEMLKGSGSVIACDVDQSRCHALVHQLGRVGTSNVLVICEGAQKLKLDVRFDCVLADVPCSGDGTARKNADASGSLWKLSRVLGLHGMQRKILRRGLELLKVGGICVYSTCSFNPYEDESVVGSVLAEVGDAVEIMDASEILPDVRRRPGIVTWPVFDDSLVTLRPTGNENLRKTMRFVPQDSDSGGFFIAVLRKLSECPVREDREKPSMPLAMHEQPFLPLPDDVVRDLQADGIDTTFLFCRSDAGARHIYYLAPPLAELVRRVGSEALRVVAGGAVVITRRERMTYPDIGAVDLLVAGGYRRVLSIDPFDGLRLLGSDKGTSIPFRDLNPGVVERARALGEGGCVLSIEGKFLYPGSIFRASLAAFVPKERLEFLRCLLREAYPDIPVDPAVVATTADSLAETP